MAVQTFDVDSYTFMIGQTSPASDDSWRHLGLTATSATASICVRASIFFFAKPTTFLGVPSGWLGVVSDVGAAGVGESCFAHLPRDAFDYWYDVLRNERPLSVTYGYLDTPAGSSSRRLEWIRLNAADQEPPGEGPEGIPGIFIPILP